MANENRNAVTMKVETPNDNASVGQAGQKVTVACKLPHGLTLQLHRKVVETIMLPGGSRTDVPRFIPDESKGTYVVAGVAVAKGEQPRALIVNDYAMTPNIPEDFWKAWWEENKDADYCRNHMIYAHTSRDHIKGMAKDFRDLRSGMEPFAQEGDPRRPKPTNPQVSAPKTDRVGNASIPDEFED